MKKGLRLKGQLLLLSLLPIFILGIAIIGVCYLEVSSTIESETQNSLKATAEAVAASYNQNQGEYFVNNNGDVWKGSYNISKSESLIESISESTGMQVTFFYGTDRIVTSLKDANGIKIIGTPMGDKVKAQVIDSGNDYFTNKVLVETTPYYGYYIPIRQNNSEEVIGAIFVGTECSKVNLKINKVVLLICILILICMFITLIIVYLAANKIVKALRMSMESVQQIAIGDLSCTSYEKSLKRKDEIGDLARSTESLKNGFGKIIDGLVKDAKILDESSVKFEEVTMNTIKEIENIQDTVSNITESAKQQAEIASEAVVAINTMEQMITKTTEEANVLTDTAADMMKNSKEVSSTLNNLQIVNKEVLSAVEDIYNDTQVTNKAADEIQSVVAVITSIAEETNLLALNASIEAARAGEAGKGFAVVASEIQNLAEQSNISSGRIVEIVNNLESNSARSVETMNKVQEIINHQSQDVINTNVVFKIVEDGIGKAIGGISKISLSTNKLNDAKSEFVNQITTLAAIAEENEANTTVAMDATENVVLISTEMSHESTELKEVSKNILNDVGIFIR